MSARTSTALQKGTARGVSASDWAYSAGWYLFVAMIALSPLAIGSLPPQFGAIATVRTYDPFTLPKTVTMLVLAGLSLSAFCVSALRGRAKVFWHPVLWIVAAIAAWAAVSTVFAPSLGLAIWGNTAKNEGLVSIVGYAIIAFLAVQYVRSGRELRVVVIAAAAAGVLISAYALVQFFGMDPYSWTNETGRIASSMGNADVLGTYLLFPIPLSVGLALSARSRSRSVLWWCAAAFMAAALLASGTRGAWIGGLVMVAAVSVVGWGSALAKSRARLIGVALLVLAVLALAAVIVYTRSSHAWTSATLLTRLSNGRTVIWLTGLRAWLMRPITGWGPDGFVRAFERAVGPSWYSLVNGYYSVDSAHSVIIDRLVTLGAPGLALTLWAIIQALVVSLKDMAADKPERLLSLAVWGALVGVVGALCFGVPVPEVSMCVWLSVGLLIAPSASAAARLPRPIPAVFAVAGVCLAVWAGTWLVADVMAGQAMELPAGFDRAAQLEAASGLNPLSPSYRGLAADTLLDVAAAQQQSGASPAVYNETMREAIGAYESAASADRGDALIRAALSNLLIGYSHNVPTSGAAVRAVAVMEEARSLAPGDAAVLCTLARAYQAAGRMSDAREAARLAREAAPDYASQTLGPLGL